MRTDLGEGVRKRDHTQTWGNVRNIQAKREPEKKMHMAEHIPDEVAEAVRKADFHE